MTNVVSLNGGPTGVPTPNQNAIQVLRMLLDKAEAGEIVGVAAAALHYDHLASWQMGGLVGSFGLVGAIEVMRADLVQVHLAPEK